MISGKRDTSKKRKSIIQAATKAFREEGYDAASMDIIAEIAGASKRTVYNHFSSKQELFQAVIDNSLEELVVLKQVPYDPGRSLEAQLSQFADAKLTSVRNPAWLSLTKVVLSVFIRDPELARATIGKAESGEDALVTWLRAAADDGKITVTDAELAAKLFWSMITGAFIWPMVFTGPLDPETTTALKQEIILTFLSRYRAKT